MKIISLNTWGGRGGKENLLKFIEKYKDTDIFCLQEMWNGGEHMGAINRAPDSVSSLELER